MFNNGVNTHGLRWRPRLKVWKSSNNVFDPETMHAKSYGWWTYFTVIKGLKVFNAHYYSSATRCHQNELRAVLKKLRIKIDVEVDTKKSLDRVSDLREAVKDLYVELFCEEIKASRSTRKDARAQRWRLRRLKELRKSIQAFERLVRVSKRAVREFKAQAVKADADALSSKRLAREYERDAAAKRKTEAKELLNSSWINVA